MRGSHDLAQRADARCGVLVAGVGMAAETLWHRAPDYRVGSRPATPPGDRSAVKRGMRFGAATGPSRRVSAWRFLSGLSVADRVFSGRRSGQHAPIAEKGNSRALH